MAAAGDFEKSSKHQRLSNFSLNELQDLLIEVLVRLPTFKSAFQCKRVCKLWYSLISDPYFARRFITHHHYKQKSSALIINHSIKDYGHGIFAVSDEPMFKSSGFELKCILPNREKRVSPMVLAIDKDLILCAIDNSSQRFQGCVCNPFTKQWLTLPLLQHDDVSRYTDVGFVCEPYYFEDAQAECTLNCNYRFRVVEINQVRKVGLVLWTYFSETQRWNRSVLTSDEYGTISTGVVTYNGRLLWYNGRTICAYDPFNPELSTIIDCSYIHSTRFLSSEDDYFLGLSKGFLRMMQWVGWGVRERLAIWELKDEIAGEWRLEKKVFLDTMMPESCLINETKYDSEFFVPLGFHLSDGNIVYLNFKTFVILCNLQTEELRMAGEVPSGGHFSNSDDVFHIELPLWPTPIHKIN